MDQNVKLLDLFWKFFKIGLFTFGGGYAMIPLIEKEMVDSGYVDKKDIVDLVAISQSIPGAVAVNMSLFVGFKIAKKKGAIISVLGCIMPSFLIILLIALLFSNFQNEIIIQHAFIGVLSAVVALILLSAYRISKVAILDPITFIITVITVVLLLLTSIHAMLLIVSGALTGILIYYVYPKKVRKIMQKTGDDK